MVEKGWNGLEMARYLLVVNIRSLGPVPKGDTSFWAEPELDSFLGGIGM